MRREIWMRQDGTPELHFWPSARDDDGQPLPPRPDATQVYYARGPARPMTHDARS